jgi:glycerol kinase
MAFQTTDIIKVMEKEAGVSLNELSVDGGASANDLLLQTQADLLAIPINRPACIETTALGAANLAGLAVGVFKSTDEIAVRRQAGARFVPAIEDSLRDERIRNWKRAVERCKGWADNK